VDTRKILDVLTKNPAAAGALGGLAGSLLGNVLTGGKLRVGGLVKVGGLATVGYLAYQAWQRHQAQRSGLPVPALPASVPAAFDLESATHGAQALRVIKAMVAAAKADGVVDAAEQSKIAERIRAANLSADDQAVVTRILMAPMNLDDVIGGLDSPELATEVYAASLLAVYPANRAERAYLDMLAARLNLEPGLVAELESGVSAESAAVR
jgi:uncharacterized membrane protein YebE (DUF533 family)